MTNILVASNYYDGNFEDDKNLQAHFNIAFKKLVKRVKNWTENNDFRRIERSEWL
jgi:hypothetical protein